LCHCHAKSIQKNQAKFPQNRRAVDRKEPKLTSRATPTVRRRRPEESSEDVVAEQQSQHAEGPANQLGPGGSGRATASFLSTKKTNK